VAADEAADRADADDAGRMRSGPARCRSGSTNPGYPTTLLGGGTNPLAGRRAYGGNNPPFPSTNRITMFSVTPRPVRAGGVCRAAGRSGLAPRGSWRWLCLCGGAAAALGRTSRLWYTQARCSPGWSKTSVLSRMRSAS
jgi:hypothetical protein